jgi:hypothetical protein
MKRFLLCLMCLALLAVGCKKGQQQPAPTPGAGEQNYLPMAADNRWTWIGGIAPATGDTITWQVKDRVVRKTGQFAWKVVTKRYWQEKHHTVVDSMDLQVEPNCLLMYMDNIDPDADTILSYPLTMGKKWVVAYIITMRITRTAQVAGLEDVNTPYGQFKGALRIDSEDRSAEKDSLVMKTSDWYVPNVGRIMSRIEARGGVWEMKLLTAEIHK